MITQSFQFEFRLVLLEDAGDEQLLQLLIGEIYAHLLETVMSEHLEAKYI